MSRISADTTSAERRLYAIALAALALIASLSATCQPAKKTSAGLEGERCRLRPARSNVRAAAHYRRAGSTGYVVTATCPTASARASQATSVRQVGENKYAGSFYNSEYGISGVISIVVHGRSQTVPVQSDSGSAVISLSR
jgi:hypothetical protein